MVPMLEPDDIVFIRPATQCQKDDIVAIRHPHKKTILIKYVKEIDENDILSEDGQRLQLEIDEHLEAQLLITVAPSGFLKRTRKKV